jgi:hypothetical protein
MESLRHRQHTSDVDYECISSLSLTTPTRFRRTARSYELRWRLPEIQSSMAPAPVKRPELIGLI